MIHQLPDAAADAKPQPKASEEVLPDCKGLHCGAHEDAACIEVAVAVVVVGGVLQVDDARDLLDHDGPHKDRNVVDHLRSGDIGWQW